MIDVLFLSNSQYVWWIGDDDIVIPGAIERIIKKIEENKDLSLFLINAKLVSQDLKKVLNDKFWEHEIQCEYNSCKEFFRQACFRMPFGTVVINANLAKKIEAKRYFGTSHAYTGVILDYLEDEYLKKGNNQICCIKEPCVCLRCGIKSWSEQSVEIHLRHIPKWFSLLGPVYYPEKKQLFYQYIEEQFETKKLEEYCRKRMVSLENFTYFTQYIPKDFRLKLFFVMAKYIEENLRNSCIPE